MSRWIIQNRDGSYNTELDDKEMCRHLIDEVCTNPDCDQCCDYPYPSEDCHINSETRCPHFEAEEAMK